MSNAAKKSTKEVTTVITTPEINAISPLATESDFLADLKQLAALRSKAENAVNALRAQNAAYAADIAAINEKIKANLELIAAATGVKERVKGTGAGERTRTSVLKGCGIHTKHGVKMNHDCEWYVAEQAKAATQVNA